MKKTLDDLKPGQQVYFVCGNIIKGVTVRVISIKKIEFSGFDEVEISEEDKTRWNIDVRQRYGNIETLYFNKIDALKSLKKKRETDLFKFNERFKNLIEDLETTQKELFQIKLDIIEETKKLLTP